MSAEPHLREFLAGPEAGPGSLAVPWPPGQAGAYPGVPPPWVTKEVARVEFPILGRLVGDRPLVYLDSAATTQKPRCVLGRMQSYYDGFNANVHRGLHTLSAEATAAYEAARDALALHLNAWDRRGVVFTRSFTEAANLVAHSFARQRLVPGDEILCSVAEHHSNLVPWQQAALHTGATLRYLDITEEGELDLGSLPRLVTSRTRLIAVTGLSNVLGGRVDLGPVVAAARGVGAAVFVDASQLVPHCAVDMQALDVDFLGLSAHKMLGPTGVGALVARPELLEAMPPFMTGGEMVAEVTLEGATWTDPPWRFEAGTPMIAEVLGWHAALDYLARLGAGSVEAHGLALARYGLSLLGEIPGLRLYGPKGKGAYRAPLFAFNLHDAGGRRLHPADVGMALDRLGIAVRTGHHCAAPLHHRLGVSGTVRASAYIYNTEADLDALAEGLLRVRRLLSGRGRAGR